MGVSVGQGCGEAFQLLALLHLKPAFPPSTISLPLPQLSLSRRMATILFLQLLYRVGVQGEKIFFRNELNILSWQRF